MSCEQVEEHLSAYLDDALFPEDRQFVANHLAGCRSCQKLLAELTRFDALLAQLPRISPDPSLYVRIFSSQEYLELVGHATIHEPGSRSGALFSQDQGNRPMLIALPDGQRTQFPTKKAPALPKTTSYPLPITRKNRPFLLDRRILYSIIAACVLLTLGVGGLISWRLWQRQAPVTQTAGAIPPPAALPSQGPLPAGKRFLFLRDGSLWSCSADGTGGIVRLTSETITVAEGWMVRPALNGHSAGNLLAYIDLQQGQVHIMRSDGQNDIALAQPLLPTQQLNSGTWQSAAGTEVLNSLAWSPDGSQLAFISRTSSRSGLYFYQTTTGKLTHALLPFTGDVSHPNWAPDSQHIALRFTQHGTVGIAEYNLQNQQALPLVKRVSTDAHTNDTVMTLAWSPDRTHLALTWSVGSIGHVHSIWLQPLATTGQLPPRLLRMGDYVQASYTPAQTGRWFFVTTPAGLDGDIYSINLEGFLTKLTQGKEATSVQWSPQGRFISYLDTSTSAVGTLHLVNTLTDTDTPVATDVVSAPSPVWSMDEQQLAYSTGPHTFMLATQGNLSPRSVKLQGHATTLSWSLNTPAQLVLALDDTQEGIYLLNNQQNSVQLLDHIGLTGSIQWSEIP